MQGVAQPPTIYPDGAFSTLTTNLLSVDIIVDTIVISSLTPQTTLISDSSSTIASSITTSTELSYVHGVTSSIQDQLDSKMPITVISGTANEISVQDTDDNVIISIANNPIFPGFSGITWPSGNTSLRAGGAGTTRFNSQNMVFEGTVDGTTWATFTSSSTSITSVTATSPLSSSGGNNPDISLTGIISPVYGGTGINNGSSTLTLGGNLSTSGAYSSTFTMTGTTAVTFPTNGTLATISQLPTPAALTEVNDTNVTLTLGGSPSTALLEATSITAGWTGQLSLTRGGTNASLTASNGGIFYSTASAGAILSGTSTANQILVSGASSAPSWSTATYPPTTTINQLLYSSAANTIGGLATANSAVLVTGSGGVPVYSSTMTNGQIIIGQTGGTPAAETISGDASLAAGGGLTLATVNASPGSTTLSSITTNGKGLVTANTTGNLTGDVTSVGLATTYNNIVPLAKGGTYANLTASAGSITYSGSSALALSTVGTSGQVLTSGGASAPTWTTATVTPTTGDIVEWDTNRNLSANNFIEGYATITTAGSTTTLTVASSYQQFFTGTTTQTVQMPVTSTLVLGQSWEIVNNSTGVVTIQSSGSNTITTLSSGQATTVTCILTSGTTASSWSVPAIISTAAGGSNTQVQYNSSGAFAGSAALTYDGVGTLSIGDSSQQDWFQGSKLLPTSNTGNSEAGTAVSIVTNGSTYTAIVGGPDDNGNIGAAWVYQSTNSGTTWSYITKLIPTSYTGTPEFGTSVSLVFGGSPVYYTAIIGGPNNNSGAGAIWIFQSTNGGTAWAQVGLPFSNSTSSFGQSVSMVYVSGNTSSSVFTALIGEPGYSSSAGTAYAYTTSNNWSSAAYTQLTPSGGSSASIGQSVSMVYTGGTYTAVIGGPNDSSGVGAIWFYQNTSGTWSQVGSKIAPGSTTNFGSSVSIAFGGSPTYYTAIIGEPGDTSSVGAFFVYQSTAGGGSGWATVGSKITPTGNIGASKFGSGVSLAYVSGNTSSSIWTAAIGGPDDNSNIGAVWFYNTSNNWTSSTGTKFIPDNVIGGSNVYVGLSVSICLAGTNYISIVGGYGDNGNIGAAWIYNYEGDTITIGNGNITLPGTITVGGAEYVGGILNVTSGTSSTTTTTGALVITGGAGISGAMYVGGVINATSTSGSQSGLPFAYYAYNGSVNTGVSPSGNSSASIIAYGRINATEFDAFSDSRIKKDIEIIDYVQATKVIEALRPVSYSYIDFKKGTGKKQGLIADEVLEQLPTAVNMNTEFIPNIYKHGSIIGNKLYVEYILNKDDIVSVYILQDDKEICEKLQIIECIEENVYLFEGDTKDKQDVFVYGVLVNDYKTLNYDVITINLIATVQELLSIVKTLNERISILENR